MMKKQQICILGSTGSIGTQALDVIEQHSDLYEVYCLTANNRVMELAEQAHRFHPAAVVIANEAHYEKLKDLLSDEPDIKVYAGAQEKVMSLPMSKAYHFMSTQPLANWQEEPAMPSSTKAPSSKYL